MSVWITRSAPDNLATARRLRDRGYESVMVPVVHTHALHQEPIEGRPDAIVFSSAHAVRHHLRPAVNDTVPVLVASDECARAALAAGYLNVTSTGGDADILAGLLAHILPPGGRVVEFCSQRTSRGMARFLSAGGARVDHLPVYETVAADPAEIDNPAFCSRVGGIVIHSRTGAQSIRGIIERNRWRGRVWCISPASAEYLVGLDGVELSCAGAPTERALLDRVERDVLPTRWLARIGRDRKPLLAGPIPRKAEHRPANDLESGDGDDDTPPAAA